MKEENKYNGWENGWVKLIQRNDFGLTNKELESLIDWGDTKTKEPTKNYEYILIRR